MLCREEITLVSAVGGRSAPASSARAIGSGPSSGSSETRLRQAPDGASSRVEQEIELDPDDPDVEVAPPTSRRFDTLRSLRAAPAVAPESARFPTSQSALTGCALNVEWGAFC